MLEPLPMPGWQRTFLAAATLAALALALCYALAPRIASAGAPAHELPVPAAPQHFSQPVTPTLTLEPAETGSPTTTPTETATNTATPALATATATQASTSTPTSTGVTPSATPTSTEVATPSAPAATPTPTSVGKMLTPTTTGTALPPSLQQAAGLQLEINKVLQGSDLVQVGEYLTFTIQIRNTGSVVVTTLPLVDDYDPAVLQPILSRMDPPPDLTDTGVMTWTDLTNFPAFGDLAPGESITVVTVFRAIGISDNVINHAAVVAAVGAGGESGNPIEDGDGGGVEGGSVIISKALIEDFTRADTPVISFTITVRNEGAADLVRVPVVDDYDTNFLGFISSNPSPSSIDTINGTLRWDNLLASLGMARLRPDEVITITTVFTVVAPIDNLVVNSVAGTDVRDEFNNEVAAPRQADVRIRIIGGRAAAETATPTAITEDEEEEQERDQSTATATTQALTPIAESTATAVVQADITATAGSTVVSDTAGVAENRPATLPRTGARESGNGILVIGIALVLAGLFALLYRRAVH